MPQPSRSAETSKPSETGSLTPAGSPAASPVATGSSSPAASTSPSKETAASREVATFGAGCFWCVEAVLQQLDGVLDVKSGYMGGDVPNPTYEQVCTGTTGHAEVVQITFDPAKITYTDLLGWYFKLHDPTTLNRQGNDVGTQYRSVIFYHSDAQKAAAQSVKAKLAASGAFRSTIVTEISPAGPFYEAEKYHQDYYRQNRAQPYCRYVITPKLEKLGLEK
jgi:peptide-methionine (S)-S-oxide reductase